MSVEAITRLFTRSNGEFVFARWGRPIAPIVFGVEDQTIATVKGAVEAVVTLAGHKMAETDPELGANMMWFFLRDWSELLETPDLDRLIPDLAPLVGRLQAADANQYRIFRFEPDGAIKACFVFIRMDEIMSDIPADVLTLGQAVQSILLWSDEAFLGSSIMIAGEDGPVLRPDIADVVRAAYDPVLPSATQSETHALRLQARITASQGPLQ
ncbi:hypothetical protein [Pontivivens insulae]|uniref:Uncharacterized protein n=1 Tax=Pontivivens insulae TaxID=1639689 RepID=A0A2R8A966_9RHOB|nr:hypothetical protein [Pontivivens insulae]RED18680.1 hypothetical protein DFR53_0879 [Pontivivens insulae]SPF28578.1 hypothetical protein POI8812_00880 [Pontivivens insulae]